MASCVGGARGGAPFERAQLRGTEFGYKGLGELRRAIEEAQAEGWPVDFKKVPGPSGGAPLKPKLFRDGAVGEGPSEAEADVGLLPPADVVRYVKVKVRAPSVTAE